MLFHSALIYFNFLLIFYLLTKQNRSGAKKPPTPIEFNPTDPLHAEFIFSAANLRARMYGSHIAPIEDVQQAAALASAVLVERFRCVLIVFYLYWASEFDTDGSFPLFGLLEIRVYLDPIHNSREAIKMFST